MLEVRDHQHSKPEQVRRPSRCGPNQRSRNPLALRHREEALEAKFCVPFLGSIDDPPQGRRHA